MSLKTSFFNKSLFKSDIKRYWWVGIIQTLLFIMISVIPVYEECRRKVTIGALNMKVDLEWMSDGVFIIPVIFSICVAVLVFTYMHFTASVSTLHSMPLKRGKIFATKIASGLTITLTPVIITALILTFIILNPEYAKCYNFLDVGKWLLVGVIYTLVVFSLTSVVNMMTGNPIGTIVFTLGFAILPLIFTGFFQSFFDMELYGYAEDSVADILNHIYIGADNLLKLEYLIIYLLFTAVFFAGAYYLYRKRKLESYGEVIAFTWLKPVFIGIISILASMLSYVYFNGILSKNGLLWLLPFGVIGTVIAWMIAKKSISIKGILKPVVIYLCTAFCFIAVIHFDLTGYEKRVPALSDIESIKIINYDSMHRIWYDGEYIEYKNMGEISPYFTEAEDIKNAVALHKYLIKTKGRIIKGNAEYIPIEYKLKNGKTLRRDYHASFNDDADILKPVYETKQMRAHYFNIINGGEREFTKVKVIDRRFKNSEFITFYPDNEYMQKFIEALKQDLSNISYEDMNLRTNNSVNVIVEYENVYEFEKELPEDYIKGMNNNNDRYDIRPCFKNTVALLKEIGFYDALPKAEDFEGASVYTWKNVAFDHEYTEPVSEYKTDVKGKDEINVFEPEKIALLYSFYDKMIEEKNYRDYENCCNIKVSYRLKNGHTFEVSCSYDEDKIPTELSEYFKLGNCEIG